MTPHGRPERCGETPGEDGHSGQIGGPAWYHRGIEQDIDALHRAEFPLTAMELSEGEPVASRFDGDTTAFQRRPRGPLFLLLSARKR